MIQISDTRHPSLQDLSELMLGADPWKTLGYGPAQIEGLHRSLGSSQVLVALEGAQVVGFALGQSPFLIGDYLKCLAVRDTHQGQGVGRLLMDEFEARAFRQRPNVYACVSSFNAPARAFYLKRGYQEVGVLSQLLSSEHDEILLRKSIGSWNLFLSKQPRTP